MKAETERWLDEPGLSEALQALRDERPRDAEVPAGVKDAVRLRLGTSLANLGGPALGGKDAAPSPRESAPEWGSAHPTSMVPASLKAAAQVGWLPAGVKVLLSGLLVGGSALLVWPKSGEDREPVPATSTITGRTLPTQAEPSSESPSRAKAAEGSLTSLGRAPAHLVEDASHRAPRISSRSGRASSASLDQPKADRTKKVPRDTKTDLDYELTLLRLARVALADRPAFAKELLRNYDKLFPEGVLRNEYELLLKRAESLPKESLNPVE
jgi:hypothetical protein